MSLSESLVYAPKPSAVSGSAYRQNLPTYNKSIFNPGEVMMLNIPTGRRGEFLNTRMSYLKIKVTNTSSTTPMTFDYSASSIIERLELYHGSNLLEQIHGYNVLHALFQDAMGSVESQLSTGSVIEGFSPDNDRKGATILPNTYMIFCIPILSGIIGVGQDKYLPTGSMVGDMRLELTLANQKDAVICPAATVPPVTTPPTAPTTLAPATWQVTDVELMLEYTQLNSEAARMIEMQNSSGYMISFDTYAQYTNTVENGATNANILIPARYSSLKTLYTVFRPQGNIGNANVPTLTYRQNLFSNGGQWYYSIGGKNVPVTPVKSQIEAFAELQKAQHAFGAMNASSAIDLVTWSGTATECTFMLATDLETLPHKSKLTESGVNTLAVNTHLVCQFAGLLNAASHVSTFAHYDGVLLIQNGIASVMF